jgi:murein DD-endopeptidase MepM/ murein hydrolase activator NlpD
MPAALPEGPAGPHVYAGTSSRIDPSEREDGLRLRLVRASIAVTILSTLLIPAVGSVAGPHKELEKTRAKLEALRDEIAVDSSKARSLRGTIDTLSAQITELQKQINHFDARITVVRSRVRSAQARIDATQAKIDRIKDDATAQARALYESGGTHTLDTLLGSESISELDRRLEMLGMAAEESTGTLIEYGRLRQEVQAQHEILFGIEQELAAELEARSNAFDELAERRSEIAVRLDDLNGDLAEAHDHEHDLAAKADGLRRRIIAAQAQRSVTSLGTSSQGFIWPLNGPVTSGYGYRWGRLHAGIDISGYTGQPIVSAKSGVVIEAGSMGGYGNATIIDHGGGIATLYGHQTSISVGVGERVSQGEIIGTVGSTGYSTGPHLHFEVRVNGSPQNPMNYLP